MKLKAIFRFFKSPISFGLTVFAITLLLTQYLSYQRYLLLETNSQKKLVTQANWVEHEFHKTLDQGYSTTQTLAFILEHYGIPKNFDSISKLLLETNTEVSALEIVNKEGIITHAFPLEGNEVLGFNILKDSIGKIGALKTIKKKDHFVSGPIRLKQGGIGFISRTPIFNGDSFEGFTSAIILLEDVLNTAKLNSQESQFLYRLTKLNSNQTEEVYFSSYDDISTNSFSSTVKMPDGEWKLYVYAKEDTSIIGILLFAFIGLFISVLSGSIAWYLLKQPKRLDRLVREKNSQLVESEEKYRSLVEQASDGIVLSDQTGKILDVNLKACELFRYTKAELLKSNLTDLTSKDQASDIPFRINKLLEEQTLLSQRKLLRKDGSDFYGEISAKILSNGLIQGIVRDVSARIALELKSKENAEKVKESEEKYRTAIEEASDGIFVLDEHFNFIDINIQFCKFFRSPKETFISKNIIHIIAPDELAKKPLKFKEVSNGEVIRTLRKMIREDGSTFVAQVSVKQMPNNHYQGILQDVTAREEIAETLRESTLKYRELTERISDGFVALDKNWNFNYVNAKACQVIGKSYSKLIGTSAWAALPFFRKTNAYKVLLEAMETQEYKYIKQYREDFDKWYEYRMFPSAEGISVYFKDITEIKKAEEELLHTKAKMESAIRIGKIGYWSWDYKKEIIDWSELMYNIFDIDPNTPLTYETIQSRIHPDDLKKQDDLINIFISNSENNLRYTHRIIHRDKSVHTLLVETEIEKNDKNEILKLRGTILDITETIKVKEELKESQEKFYKSFHSNLIGKVIVDENRKILEANRTIAVLLETTRKNLIGKTLIEADVLEFKSNELSADRQQLWAKLLNEGILRDEEIIYTLKSGKKIPALLSIEPLKLKNKRNYLVSAIDNTKRKEAEHLLERQNIELSKTNAELDRFVYSASHELRAPLASVMGLIDIILHEDHDEDLVFKLNMMQQSVKRLDDFIKDIVQYSQNKHLEIAMESINFKELINESLEGLWFLENRKHINFQLDINETQSFFSDKKRISIIFNNLISNAIKYHNITTENPTITITVTTKEDAVSIEIADNGIGIPKAHLDKIFQMFYRVSSKIMGTGIGLFVIKEVITKLNGRINVLSEPNMGTKFVILLPNQTKNAVKHEVQTNFVNR
ncbi:multi-sensor signal transduction histidine kinase [Cellulophaga algicola DSM 14237]|uniref:histidine kinase n=1 Tax=Cellulophaga algicola (strain DSM 14237 / IC166 / ACAM 630) TaxID=688270 RepID=E6X9H0_CELAD|nr:PAS domain S-box protein [Cellulophaga algicola]ADV48720.1 multi-sensor signal transduction histidine kinase [Cellulophaga algicola DSM 14237]